MPRTLQTWLVSMDSSRVREGRMIGSLRASMLLPLPGGPSMRRLCPPAAATSRARLAWRWPLI